MKSVKPLLVILMSLALLLSPVLALAGGDTPDDGSTEGHPWDDSADDARPVPRAAEPCHRVTAAARRGWRTSASPGGGLTAIGVRSPRGGFFLPV